MKESNKLSAVILVSSLIIAGALIFSNTNGSIDEESFDNLLETYEERQYAKLLEGEDAKKILKIKENDRVLGEKEADITIFEYSDFECPYCKKFYPEVNKVVEEFRGKVNLVYRHFPGLHQPLSVVEANAAECAGEIGGDEVFYKYHDELYERTESNGSSLIKVEGRGIEVSELGKIAEELNLDMDKFNKCFASMKYESKVKENTESGSTIGVSGTPNAFIVNNKTGKTRKIGGFVAYSYLKEKIEEVIE